MSMCEHKEPQQEQQNGERHHAGHKRALEAGLGLRSHAAGACVAQPSYRESAAVHGNPMKRSSGLKKAALQADWEWPAGTPQAVLPKNPDLSGKILTLGALDLGRLCKGVTLWQLPGWRAFCRNSKPPRVRNSPVSASHASTRNGWLATLPQLRLVFRWPAREDSAVRAD
jgi:hypothetical protein